MKWGSGLMKAGSFRFSEGVMLQFPFSYFLFSFILNSANPLLLSPPVELLFYIYRFHQNPLIHIPSFYFPHNIEYPFQLSI